MSVGFQAFTDSGLFQIDGSTPNYQLTASLSAVSQQTNIPTVINNASIQYTGTFWLCSFTFRSDQPPLWAFTADSGIMVTPWDFKRDGNLYTVRLITAAQTTVHLFVYSRVPVPSSRFGLQVFSPNGTLIADASQPFCKILDVVSGQYLPDYGWTVTRFPQGAAQTYDYGRPVAIGCMWPAHYISGSTNSNQRLWDIAEMSAVGVSGGVVTWELHRYNGGNPPNITCYRECMHYRFMVLDMTGVL
ncbi:hypothetical protein GQ57_38200 [Burkholderia sp. MSh2]|uniref:Gp22 n=1 Tax=Burkholderia paludis TaxID=1506587 RepID=A0A6J5D2P6_9BURK|nr:MULTISPECIES: hypothetical protein [Burkholderia]KEZ00899.1 hypothetical protein GQ57_38200 [Burkholderia sp. MSh2]CAB3747512.1 hypothetical protein LMG30113_00416 [Burkholderia paludis]VWC24275.1 hypothetical protein BPA30113_05908 [Burkholderia paludis]